MTTADITIHHEVTLSATQISDVLQLINSTAQADGTMPISEHVLLHLRHGGDDHGQHLLARDPTHGLVGYAHLDVTDTVQGASAEVLVEPAHRRQGIGRTMITALDDLVVGSRLRLWAHGEQPGARELAESLGFRSVRVLWQMRRSLLAALPRAAVPAGVTIRSFDLQRDPDAWVALNTQAFAGHPEQGGWTREDLDLRMSEPWFDPVGFLLAIQEATGQVIGFHWTKVHGFDPADRHAKDGAHAHEPIGEVYVVGVRPDFRGSGLGRALTILGLEHLRNQGLAQAMLYVDAGNTRAIRLYEGLGFARWDTDVMYQRPAKANVR